MHNSYISSLYSQEITENSKLWVEKNPKEDSIRIRYNCLWKGCQSYCDNINILDEHINKHIEDEPQFISVNQQLISCCIRGCGIMVTSKMELLRHIRMHIFHAQKQFNGLLLVHTRFPELKSCNFPSWSKLVYQGDSLICEWNNCLKIFVDLNEYVEHLSQHIDELTKSDRNENGLYSCLWGLDCKFLVRSKSSLRVHIQHHSGDKTCACPFCGVFFANNTKLIDHVTRRQKGDPDFFCFFCQKTFKTVRLLKIHCQRHVRNYKCKFCSIAMESIFDLRRHVATVHAKIRNFFCDKCGKGFFQRSDLNKHSTTHLENLSFSCTICEKKYRWEKQLRFHLKTHDKDNIESPYLCHLCDSRYRRGSALSKHFSTNHELSLPEGFSRFQYKKCSDGLFRLQTKRCLSKNLLEKQALVESTSANI